MDTVISVVIPCYKSSKTIRTVVDEVRDSILSREGFDYQIVLVNDYPYDDTFAVISSICSKDSKVVGINLSKNFGQTYAKIAALPYVTGDIMVYMDDDGQHPANEIYKLVDCILDGYDVAYAYFQHKKHSLFKRITSAMNRKLSEWNGTKPKGITVSSYVAHSAFVVEQLKKYKSPYPSLGGYVNCITTKYTQVEMEHRERLEGTSNYSFRKMFSLWALGFFNFSLVPLRVATYIGGICAVAGIIYGIIVVIRRLLSTSIAAGYSSILASILFIGGLIMLMLGIIGEYLGRIYMTISDKPQVVIRDVINDPKDK